MLPGKKCLEALNLRHGNEAYPDFNLYYVLIAQVSLILQGMQWIHVGYWELNFIKLTLGSTFAIAHLTKMSCSTDVPGSQREILHDPISHADLTVRKKCLVCCFSASELAGGPSFRALTRGLCCAHWSVWSRLQLLTPYLSAQGRDTALSNTWNLSQWSDHCDTRTLLATERRKTT